jgi:hypothetical protein
MQQFDILPGSEGRFPTSSFQLPTMMCIFLFGILEKKKKCRIRSFVKPCYQQLESIIAQSLEKSWEPRI